MRKPEFALIDWIKKQVLTRSDVPLGIGDDAAGLRFDPTRETLLATDLLMEGVHFTFPPATPELAGRKALAVNLSDIAAMAGAPIAAFVSVALPRSRGVEFAQRVHQGVLDLAREWNVALAGGDTNTWDGPLVINVAVVGSSLGTEGVRRRGAQPGDVIIVTGDLGGSLGGKHLQFTPRLKEAARMRELSPIHAMIDISDGLAADLHHILEASGVGAIVEADRLPLSTAVRYQYPTSKETLLHALSDGEDFELLLTIPQTEVSNLFKNWNMTTPLTVIGEVAANRDCLLRSPDGSLEELPPLGWGHAL